ncbi:LysR family transcriptional regulator [Labrenzia sp. OB1]|uniref:LysR family transcriptional regulator n=1 Tax=Labrenzia sp. OB1 TaxID=1561204 RepID=UPI0007B293C4|nr:LysR family transcriptional regulator [Labrenzia sp. OB1]KZM49535.1 hypothetical protein OA90_13665 [Labrenzia sp. OB1]
MIKIRQLIYLKKAIETGNITRAADQLHVAQTALGIQIRNLEDQLGAKLLKRHSRGVTATPAGELLVRHADDILARVQQAEEAVRAMAGTGTRSLAIGLPPSVIRLVGDYVTMSLSQRCPEIALKVVEGLSFTLTRQLALGELDCAFTYLPSIDQQLDRIALLEEELFYITSPSFDTGEGPIKFSEALASDLALTGRDDAVFQITKQNAERLGLDLNVTYEVQSIRAVKNLVAKGVAATIMPFGAAEGELRKGVLKARHIVAPSIIRTLMFVHSRDKAPMMADAQIGDLVNSITDLLLAAEGPIMRRL